MINKQGVALAAAFLVFHQAASAAVYKSVDENGVVVYTDEPVGNAKPVDLPPLSTVPPPRYVPAVDESQPGESGFAYKTLAITSPTQDETVRNNPGNVWLKASVAPPLNDAAGDRLQFFLDDKPFGEPGKVEKVLVPNLDRGAHTVSVAVVSPSGKVVKRSDEVRFYLHRQSVNFPRGPAQP